MESIARNNMAEKKEKSNTIITWADVKANPDKNWNYYRCGLPIVTCAMKQAYPNETWDELITPIVIPRPIINPNITWADVKP
jgi:hypothetical protein